VAFTSRILALLDDDPQPVVKQAKTISPRPAQNNPQIRRRINALLYLKCLLDADWMRTNEVLVVGGL
jgi:hypothetical protein